MKKGWLRHLDFIMIDVLSIELALCFVYVFSAYMFSLNTESLWKLSLILPLINFTLGIMLDNYNGILQRGYMREFSALLKLEGISFALLQFLFYFLRLEFDFPRRVFLLCFISVFVITYIFRFLHKFYLHKRYHRVKYSRQIVVATTEAFAHEMAETITQSAIRNYQFFGLAVLDKSMIGSKIENITVSADSGTFLQYIKDQIVDEVLINLPNSPELALSLARQLLDMGVTVHIYMESAYQSLPNRSISNVFGYNVLTAAVSPISFRQSLLKRTFDILGGIIGCIACVLVGIIIGPIIYIKSPGPIIFAQTRIGKKGRPFKFYKFRSMYPDAEQRKQALMEQNRINDGLMFKLDNDPRIISGIGNFIRKTSLDEFPQFWNVLKGDMSLVGTRPPTADEYARYSPHHKKRLSMLPGITGLWQVSGRSNITDFEEVIRLDTEYIENWSIELDLKILFKTVTAVFTKSGSM